MVLENEDELSSTSGASNLQQHLQEEHLKKDDCGTFSSNNVSKQHGPWSLLLWIYLKSLGLYCKAPFVTVRCCSKCKESGREEFLTMTSFRQHHCDVCESFLWDHNGKVCFITDDDIGATRLNHRGSFVLSNIWIILIISATIVLFVLNFIRYEEHSDDLVETISTLCIQGLLSIPVICSFMCNFHSIWQHFAPGEWASAINPVFLVQRLRWVNMRKTRVAGYVLFFVAIFFITLQCSRVTLTLYAYGSNVTFFTPITYFTIIIGIFNFTGLVYVAYLLRRSFEKEVRLVCIFTQKHIDDLNTCRQRLAEAFDTFHRFREFTSGWMSLNVIFAVVSILLEVHVWITNTKPMPYYRYERLVFLCACFVVPILAIGNVNVDYLWNRLVRQISRMRSSDKEYHWDKLMQFLQEQRPGNRPWQSVMAFILSIIAVFAAIQFRILSSKAINSATDVKSLNITELI